MPKIYTEAICKLINLIYARMAQLFLTSTNNHHYYLNKDSNTQPTPGQLGYFK
jgi:hypothetical protein